MCQALFYELHLKLIYLILIAVLQSMYTIIIPTLLMKRLRHQVVKYFV